MSAAHHDSLINEQVCPISLDMLAQLIRTDSDARGELIAAIAPAIRVRLAFFCYNRVHLRTLAFDIALGCEIKDLRLLAGAKGDLLHSQASDFKRGGGEEGRKGKIVSLARRAVG